MQIDPKAAMWLNILALVMSVLAMAGWWGDLLGQHTAAIVTGIMTTSVSALNIVLHAYAPPQAGPLAQQAPPTPANVARLILPFVIVLLALSLLTPAHAQTPLPKSRPITAAATTSLPFDPIGDMMAKLDAIKQDIITGVIADLTAADQDAATLTNPNDPTSFRDAIAHACYPAAIKFLQSLPTAQPLQGNPAFAAVQLFQRKRDFIAQIRAGLPIYLKLGCTPLLGDEIQTLVSLLGLVGVKVIPAALTALLPPLAPITLPAMTLVP